MSKIPHRLLNIVFLFIFNLVVGKDLEIIILHNSDMHARFDEISADGTRCMQRDSKLCYGGISRTAYIIKQHRENAKKGTGPPVLYLNSGDTFTGSIWFILFKEKIVIDVLNFLKPDAASLGNHEFDEDISVLTEFLNKSNYPIVTANIDDHRLIGLKKSTILTVAGYKIGVIGYLTRESIHSLKIRNVKITDEVTAINREAKQLKNKGIKTLIALGHSGFNIDKEIARNCPLIDLVIGGHSNTLLWTGKQPNTEKPEGPYPIVIQQANGKKVPVVEAYAYTKYIGKLRIVINTKTGQLISFKGNPILLDSSKPKDEEANAILDKYRGKVFELEHQVVGKTNVLLDGRQNACRLRECNLGNLIADSFVDYRVQQHKGKGWTDTAIAIINSGLIGTSFNPEKFGSNISYVDLREIMHFATEVYLISLSGKILLKILEQSVHNYGDIESGAFLQHSGLKVVYDVETSKNKPRLVSAKALCTWCKVPVYLPIQNKLIYRVIIPHFLAIGGDGYTAFTNKFKSKTKLDIDTFTCFLKYVQNQHFIYPKKEGRIKILTKFSHKMRRIKNKAKLIIFDKEIQILLIFLCIIIFRLFVV